MKSLFSFQNLKARWLADTPKFWKKIIRLCITLAGCCTAVLTINTTVPGLEIPALAQMICTRVLLVCTVLATFAKLTACPDSEIDNQLNK